MLKFRLRLNPTDPDMVEMWGQNHKGEYKILYSVFHSDGVHTSTIPLMDNEVYDILHENGTVEVTMQLANPK